MVRHPYGETIILHRFKEHARNAHGQTTKVFHPDQTIEGAAVAPHSSGEPNDGLSERVTYGLRVFIGPGWDVAPEDEVTVRGKRFAVDGSVSGDWVNPFNGHSPGAEIRLKKVTG